jgi:hypothetical protein
VLGVTSLGTWAVVPADSPADDKVASPVAHVAKANAKGKAAAPPVTPLEPGTRP